MKYSVPLINKVVPQNVNGELKTRFWTKISSNLAVGDRVHIVNGNYDTWENILINPYNKDSKGYVILEVGKTYITLDLDWTGDKPWEEDNWNDYIKVWYAGTEDKLDYELNNLSKYTNGNHVLYSSILGSPPAITTGFNVSISITTKSINDGDFNDPNNWDNGIPSPDKIAIVSENQSMFLSNNIQLGYLTVLSGAEINKGIYEIYQGLAESFYNLSESNVANYFKNSNGKLLISETFEIDGVTYKKGDIWYWDGNKLSISKEHKQAWLTRTNFRKGDFKSIFNEGIFGQYDEVAQWSGDGQWNGGALLNTEWLSGDFNNQDPEDGERFYYSKLNGNNVETYNDFSNNSGYGRNWIYDSIFNSGNINDSDVYNTEIGVINGGTISVNVNNSRLSNSQLYWSEIDYAKILNTEISDSYIWNSDGINVRLVNSIWDGGQYASDIPVISWEQLTTTRPQDGFFKEKNIFKFYIDESSWKKLKYNWVYQLRGIKTTNDIPSIPTFEFNSVTNTNDSKIYFRGSDENTNGNFSIDWEIDTDIDINLSKVSQIQLQAYQFLSGQISNVTWDSSWTNWDSNYVTPDTSTMILSGNTLRINLPLISTEYLEQGHTWVVGQYAWVSGLRNTTSPSELNFRAEITAYVSNESARYVELDVTGLGLTANFFTSGYFSIRPFVINNSTLTNGVLRGAYLNSITMSSNIIDYTYKNNENFSNLKITEQELSENEIKYFAGGTLYNVNVRNLDIQLAHIMSGQFDGGQLINGRMWDTEWIKGLVDSATLTNVNWNDGINQNGKLVDSNFLGGTFSNGTFVGGEFSQGIFLSGDLGSLDRNTSDTIFSQGTIKGGNVVNARIVGKYWKFNDTSWGKSSNVIFITSSNARSVYSNFKYSYTTTVSTLWSWGVNTTGNLFSLSTNNRFLTVNFGDSLSQKTNLRIEDDREYKVALTYDSGDVNIYSTLGNYYFTVSNSVINTTETNIHVGRRNDTDEIWNGILYDLAIYDSVITEDQWDSFISSDIFSSLGTPVHYWENTNNFTWSDQYNSVTISLTGVLGEWVQIKNVNFLNGEILPGVKWFSGNFYNGTFEGSSWESGNFYGGNFKSSNKSGLGTSKNNYTWKDGNFRGGVFDTDATWFNGNMYGGVFMGRVWNGGIVYGGLLKGNIDQDNITNPLNNNYHGFATLSNTYGLWRGGSVLGKNRAVFDGIWWLDGDFNNENARFTNGYFNGGNFYNGYMFNSYFNIWSPTWDINHNLLSIGFNDDAIWHNGIFEDGEFWYSLWKKGLFNSGKMLGANWKDGYAKHIDAYNVIWEGGTLKSGNWYGSPYNLNTMLGFTFSATFSSTYALPNGKELEIMKKQAQRLASEKLHIWNLWSNKDSLIYSSDNNSEIETEISGIGNATISLPGWSQLSQNASIRYYLSDNDKNLLGWNLSDESVVSSIVPYYIPWNWERPSIKYNLYWEESETLYNYPLDEGLYNISFDVFQKDTTNIVKYEGFGISITWSITDNNFTNPFQLDEVSFTYASSTQSQTDQVISVSYNWDVDWVTNADVDISNTDVLNQYIDNIPDLEINDTIYIGQQEDITENGLYELQADGSLLRIDKIKLSLPYWPIPTLNVVFGTPTQVWVDAGVSGLTLNPDSTINNFHIPWSQLNSIIGVTGNVYDSVNNVLIDDVYGNINEDKYLVLRNAGEYTGIWKFVNWTGWEVVDTIPLYWVFEKSTPNNLAETKPIHIFNIKIEKIEKAYTRIGNGAFLNGRWENAIWHSGNRKLVPFDNQTTHAFFDEIYQWKRLDNNEFEIVLLSKKNVNNLTIGDVVQIGNLIGIDINNKLNPLTNTLIITAVDSISIRNPFLWSKFSRPPININISEGTLITVKTKIEYPVQNIIEGDSSKKIIVTKNLWNNGQFLNGWFQGVWNSGIIKGLPNITKFDRTQINDATITGGKIENNNNDTIIQRLNILDSEFTRLNLNYNSKIKAHLNSIFLGKSNEVVNYINDNNYVPPLKPVNTSNDVLAANHRDYGIKTGTKYNLYNIPSTTWDETKWTTISGTVSWNSSAFIESSEVTFEGSQDYETKYLRVVADWDNRPNNGKAWVNPVVSNSVRTGLEFTDFTNEVFLEGWDQLNVEFVDFINGEIKNLQAWEVDSIPEPDLRERVDNTIIVPRDDYMNEDGSIDIGYDSVSISRSRSGILLDPPPTLYAYISSSGNTSVTSINFGKIAPTQTATNSIYVKVVNLSLSKVVNTTVTNGFEVYDGNVWSNDIDWSRDDSMTGFDLSLRFVGTFSNVYTTNLAISTNDIPPGTPISIPMTINVVEPVLTWSSETLTLDETDAGLYSYSSLSLSGVNLVDDVVITINSDNNSQWKIKQSVSGNWTDTLRLSASSVESGREIYVRFISNELGTKEMTLTATTVYQEVSVAIDVTVS